ncbi:MAG: DNA repair protein RecN [Bacteroidota bacterium]
MLRSLNIQNFALISELTLDFENGFTVFTGETGSGKSILLGALNLILGERADYSVIRDENQKTIVEAIFKINEYKLEQFFSDNDLDFSDEVIIRREITNQGKSRAFINDSPVQLTVLKEFSEKLIHIHSQHHTLELKSESFQLDILDYLADTIELRKDFKLDFSAYKNLSKVLSEKKTILSKALLEEDYVNFQLVELEKLNIDKISYLEMETELEQMDHLDSIKESFATIFAGISEENQILDRLSSIKNSLEKNKNLHAELASFSERIKSISLELKDISAESENLLESLQANPARKFELENLLSAYNSALIKHNCKNQEELLAIYSQFRLNESSTSDLKNEIEVLEKNLMISEKTISEKGEKLHLLRIKSSSKIEKELTAILVDLKMEKSVVQFEISKLDTPTETGFSKMSLNFSPNIGIAPKPIDKVASGGELSRFMLAVQLLMSHKKMLPTLIFDEIDTGVSGEVAQKIGELLRKMGSTLQVMAITHLPQVAAKGNAHFKVTKSDAKGKTETEVVSLSKDERTVEIARLMSGEVINEAAILNAKELMN